MSKPILNADKSLARLGAVQALYQMDLVETPLDRVLADFSQLYLGKGPDGDDVGDADADYFREIVSGVVSHQAEIDPKLEARLADGWKLKRLDSTLRAILRCGAFELGWQSDVPVKVVLNEYIEIGHDFFDGDETSVVNGVLEAVARDFRTEELPA